MGVSLGASGNVTGRPGCCVFLQFQDEAQAQCPEEWDGVVYTCHLYITCETQQLFLEVELCRQLLVCGMGTMHRGPG